MNLKSGIFTAPKTGIYAFLFAIVKSGFHMDYVDVFFRLNGIRIGDSAGGPGFLAVPVSFPVTLKLKRGDRIDLQKSKNGKLADCAPAFSGYCHHFSGWLLEEKIEM